MTDVAIIGGGIVGLATAYALTRPPLRDRVRSVVVLEAEGRVATHQTGRNSGVVHSGLYYKPGSLKARNCAEGREALYAFCAEHGVPFDRCGKIVVATRAAELPALDELERRGNANGLAGLRRLRAEEVREVEPHAAGVAGLYVPQTGIVDYKDMSATLARLVTEAGGEVRLNARLVEARPEADGLSLGTSAGPVRCRVLVNCAGLQCDRVARLCGVEPGVRIVPFRGEYYELVESRRHLVRNLIYPVPDPRFPFLGVHFTRMIGGGVECGPNAVLAWKREGYRHRDVSPRDLLDMAAWPGFWRLVSRFPITGMGEMWRSLVPSAFAAALRRLVPELRLADLKRAGSGVRAQAVGRDGRLVDDFHIVEAGRMVHVLNAPSPAATASLTIGRHVAGLAAARLA